MTVTTEQLAAWRADATEADSGSPAVSAVIRDYHLARAVSPLLDEVEHLRTRRDELLALVHKLSQTVPLESEVSEALNQRGALLAEVGTLRATVAGLRGLLASAVAMLESSSDREARKDCARWLRGEAEL